MRILADAAGDGPALAASVPFIAGTEDALPRAVTAIRGRIVAFARDQGADDAMLHRIAVAVSEAVSNAVIHAYPRCTRGQVRYVADLEDGDLEIVIADDGVGIRADPAGDGIGLGLSVIATLSSDFAITARRRGLEVWMRFVLPAPADVRRATPDVPPREPRPHSA
jgi:anti-sigma regulatory factor (Ser/Thr protein kinase)